MFQQPISETQITGARIEMAADAEALRALAALIAAATAAAEALGWHAYRQGTAIAAQDAAGLLCQASDEVGAALTLLDRTEDGDLALEIRDRADAARAEALGGVS
ncbi:MAG: hypothetical protein ACRDFS_03145 [Chloroflexota bacterium]